MKSLLPTESEVTKPYTWKRYLLDAIVGGLIVVLPLALLLLALKFIFGLATSLLHPLTELMGFSPDDEGFLVGLVSTLLLAVFLFGVGRLVSSRRGERNFYYVERRFLNRIPFYATLRDAIKAFVEREKTPFCDVVLIDCYGTGVMMTGFVTDEHPSGMITVFVPTAPNPANGCVYHVPKHLVTYIDCTIEQTMRTVVGVGVGSSDLFNFKRIVEENDLVVEEKIA